VGYDLLYWVGIDLFSESLGENLGKHCCIYFSFLDDWNSGKRNSLWYFV